MENGRSIIAAGATEVCGAAPVLDSAYLGSQTFGDIELEAELLTLFIAQARRLVPKLALDQPWERADTAHLLKGSARAIGAQCLAAAVEAYAKADATEQGPDQLAYRRVAAAFQQTDAVISARLSLLQT